MNQTAEFDKKAEIIRESQKEAMQRLLILEEKLKKRKNTKSESKSVLDSNTNSDTNSDTISDTNSDTDSNTDSNTNSYTEFKTLDKIKDDFFLKNQFSYFNYPMFNSFSNGIHTSLLKLNPNVLKNMTVDNLIEQGFLMDYQKKYGKNLIDFLKSYTTNNNFLQPCIEQLHKIYIECHVKDNFSKF